MCTLNRCVCVCCICWAIKISRDNKKKEGSKRRIKQILMGLVSLFCFIETACDVKINSSLFCFSFHEQYIYSCNRLAYILGLANRAYVVPYVLTCKCQNHIHSHSDTCASHQLLYTHRSIHSHCFCRAVRRPPKSTREKRILEICSYFMEILWVTQRWTEDNDI